MSQPPGLLAVARRPAEEWLYLSRSGCIHSSDRPNRLLTIRNNRSADKRKATTSHRATPLPLLMCGLKPEKESGRMASLLGVALDTQRSVKVRNNNLFAEVSTKGTLFGFVKVCKTHPSSSPGAGRHDVLRSRTDTGQFRVDDSADPGHVHANI